MNGNGVIRGTYDVTLEVLTRVLVGSNRDLLLGEDVIIRENKAYIINFERVIEKILSQGQSILQLSDLLSNLKRNHRTGILSTLLKTYNINLEEVAKRVVETTDNRVEKYKILKNNIVLNGVYCVPGTEIKGVMRTALIYWIVKNNIDYFRKGLLQVIDELKNGDIRDKDAGWIIEKYLKTVLRFEELNPKYRKVIHYYDVLKNIQITDPYYVNENVVLDSIVVAKRKNPFKDITSIIPAICLNKNAKMNYELNIYDKPVMPTRLHKELRELYENTIPYIWRALREYSLDLINYEKKLLRISPKNATMDFERKLNEWEKEVKSNTGVFYVKIGFGAGLYSKTIYMALPDDLKRKLEETMSFLVSRRTRGRISIWDHLTMKLVGSDHLKGKITPFAWSKIIITRK